MVDEEIVQFVGTHQVFGFLLDGAVLLGWDELRADGGVHDVEQDVACGSVIVMLGFPLHQVSYKGFGDAGIHTIHRHVVAVVGGPSERQL